MNADLRAALARLVSADARVLEVGSGHGDLIASLPNAVRMGIDICRRCVAEARRAHPGVRFETADILQMRQPPQDRDARWDAIICDRLVHSVLDLKLLLENLRAQLAEGGRIYLTAFNYLWELPTRLAEWAGWKRPAPTANWLSDSDFRNLFDIAGLEVVKYEDRLMLPLDVPGVGTALNRFAVRVPPLQTLSLYRIYALRALSGRRALRAVAARPRLRSAWWSRRATRRGTSRRPSTARRSWAPARS